MQTLNIDELADRLADWQQELPWPVEDLAVVAAAIAELAGGEPVEVARIAARADRPALEVLDFLRRSPAEFDDDGRLVGFGLTLRPTPHRVELDGRVLYTWCAPDTLELPAMLGKPVRIESPCFATGEAIRIEVDPDGVRAVDPEQAVVSIVTPDACLSDFRERACDEQHFFASAEAAAGWRDARPGAIVVPVRDGFVLTRALMARWFGTGTASDAFDRAVAEIPSCALDGAGRSEQKARYARLAPSVTSVQRATEAVVIEFDPDLDREALEETLAVERECCPFLQFDFDRQRRLRVTVADADMLPALDTIAHGFEAAP